MENNKTYDKLLLVVDVQKDFCAGGALAVPAADEIVPTINTLLELFPAKQVCLSRDIHSTLHCSFIENGGMWPRHCVAYEAGADFHPEMKAPEEALIVSKGLTDNVEQYSAFDGIVTYHLNHSQDGPMRMVSVRPVNEYLEDQGIKTIYVVGIATDYCVKATALDAIKNGFETYVVTDAIRGVEKGTSANAIAIMAEAGVKFILTSSLTKALSE